MYRDGLGGAQSKSHAFFWLSRAARNGDAKAAELRDLLFEEMTEDERSRAQMLFREMQKDKP